MKNHYDQVVEQQQEQGSQSLHDGDHEVNLVGEQYKKIIRETGGRGRGTLIFSSSPMPQAIEEMKTRGQGRIHFVLVHGISGGSWCWYKIRCLMENSGYKVSCIDLKSAGIDPTDADSVHSFDDYNKPLMDFMSSLPADNDDQVILVGHSAGGLSVTQATHKFANKIRLAVYVAATMLKLGFWTDQDRQQGVPDISSFGDVYELGFGLGPDHPPTSAIVKKEFLREIVYPLSPLEDCTLANMLSRPGPILALTSARFLSNEEERDGDGDANIDSVPRVYIKTMQDHVVKPQQQDAMIQRWSPSQVYVLDSDHMPQFSSPFLLFGLLVKAASDHLLALDP